MSISASSHKTLLFDTTAGAGQNSYLTAKHSNGQDGKGYGVSV